MLRSKVEIIVIDYVEIKLKCLNYLELHVEFLMYKKTLNVPEGENIDIKLI